MEDNKPEDSLEEPNEIIQETKEVEEEPITEVVEPSNEVIEEPVTEVVDEPIADSTEPVVVIEEPVVEEVAEDPIAEVKESTELSEPIESTDQDKNADGYDEDFSSAKPTSREVINESNNNIDNSNQSNDNNNEILIESNNDENNEQNISDVSSEVIEKPIFDNNDTAIKNIDNAAENNTSEIKNDVDVDNSTQNIDSKKDESTRPISAAAKVLSPMEIKKQKEEQEKAAANAEKLRKEQEKKEKDQKEAERKALKKAQELKIKEEMEIRLKKEKEEKEELNRIQVLQKIEDDKAFSFVYKLAGRGLDDFEELTEDESFRSVGCQTVLNSRHLILNVLGTSCSITESDFEFQDDLNQIAPTVLGSEITEFLQIYRPSLQLVFASYVLRGLQRETPNTLAPSLLLFRNPPLDSLFPSEPRIKENSHVPYVFPLSAYTVERKWWKEAGLTAHDFLLFCEDFELAQYTNKTNLIVSFRDVAAQEHNQVISFRGFCECLIRVSIIRAVSSTNAYSFLQSSVSARTKISSFFIFLGLNDIEQLGIKIKNNFIEPSSKDRAIQNADIVAATNLPSCNLSCSLLPSVINKANIQSSAVAAFIPYSADALDREIAEILGETQANNVEAANTHKQNKNNKTNILFKNMQTVFDHASLVTPRDEIDIPLSADNFEKYENFDKYDRNSISKPISDLEYLQPRKNSSNNSNKSDNRNNQFIDQKKPLAAEKKFSKVIPEAAINKPVVPVPKSQAMFPAQSSKNEQLVKNLKQAEVIANKSLANIRNLEKDKKSTNIPVPNKKIIDEKPKVAPTTSSHSSAPKAVKDHSEMNKPVLNDKPLIRDAKKSVQTQEPVAKSKPQVPSVPAINVRANMIPINQPLKDKLQPASNNSNQLMPSPPPRKNPSVVGNVQRNDNFAQQQQIPYQPYPQQHQHPYSMPTPGYNNELIDYNNYDPYGYPQQAYQQGSPPYADYYPQVMQQPIQYQQPYGFSPYPVDPNMLYPQQYTEPDNRILPNLQKSNPTRTNRK